MWVWPVLVAVKTRTGSDLFILEKVQMWPPSSCQRSTRIAVNSKLIQVQMLTSPGWVLSRVFYEYIIFNSHFNECREITTLSWIDSFWIADINKSSSVLHVFFLFAVSPFPGRFTAVILMHSVVCKMLYSKFMHTAKGYLAPSSITMCFPWINIREPYYVMYYCIQYIWQDSGM